MRTVGWHPDEDAGGVTRWWDGHAFHDDPSQDSGAPIALHVERWRRATRQRQRREPRAVDIGTLVSENRVCMITMAALAVLLCVGWFTSFAIPSLLPVILVISAIQRREPLRWLALAAVIVVLPLIALTPALRG